MKKILDATCGSRMMWFNKQNKDVLYADIRTETHVLEDRTIFITPDIEIDFRNMPFENNSFKLVVFDPPHLNQLGSTSWMAKKYGRLTSTWETDIKQGFDECMRVLDINGILIFKWSENQIKVNKIIEIIRQTPLFGHPSGKANQTIWMTFMKSN